MEIILREDISNLGTAGSIVKVKNGYGRNHLIPSGLAFLATAGNKKRMEAEAKRKEIKLAADKSDARKLAKTLSGIELTFAAKVGEGDRLFGSITSGDIAEQLAAQGRPVDKRLIELADHIKEIGEHTVSIKLHSEVRAEIKVTVVKES
jgi:large subunit ribosomal protein L9